MKRLFIYLFIFSISFSGCFWPFAGSQKKISSIDSSALASEDLKSDQNVKKGCCNQGGFLGFFCLKKYWAKWRGFFLASNHVLKDDGISFEIIDKELLVGGGKKVYMMPFAAGADALAGKFLDRRALMMVKGFFDGLGFSHRFKLLPGDRAEEADIIIDGHIEKYVERGWFRKKALIQIKGDLREASTRQVIALIFVQREVVVRKNSVDQEFYHIGSALAGRLLQ